MIFRLIFVGILFLNCNSTKKSVENTATERIMADYVIVFSSVCCGPPSDLPVKNYINQFLIKEKVQLASLESATGLGKEGEYALFIYVDNWTENQRQKFYDGLQRLHWEDEDSNSFGGVNYLTNVQRMDWLKNDNISLKELDISEWLN